MEKQKIIAVSGAKNAGKTTLIERLIPALSRRGIRTAVIKHDGHRFEPDRDGTDTYRALAAGAAGAAVFDGEKFQTVKYSRVTEKDLISLFPEADLILLEGFKDSDWPKIEVLRDGMPDGISDPGTWIALVTDRPAAASGLPVFSRGDTEAIAGFLLHCVYGDGHIHNR